MTYDKRTDIFSAGAVIYKIASGKPLINDDDITCLLDKTIDTNLEEIVMEGISDHKLRDLILSLV